MNIFRSTTIKSLHVIKRSYMPCYTLASNATKEDEKEFSKAFLLYKDLTNGSLTGLESVYEGIGVCHHVQQKEEYIVDTCRLRSLIVEYIIKNNIRSESIPKDMEKKLLEQVKKHHKHRLSDLEHSIKHYSEQNKMIYELMKESGMVQQLESDTVETRNEMRKKRIDKFSDISYNDINFWSTDKDIRVDKDTNVNNILNKYL